MAPESIEDMTLLFAVPFPALALGYNATVWDVSNDCKLGSKYRANLIRCDEGSGLLERYGKAGVFDQ
ncbi:hypothetical protein BDV34DRAFT_113647 [Aspergillus parasiticus]|uniref:Uncharacterized protein n=1 Tax=Aspergillus parasiticus TaxID=5067 RepID=A0A5N6DKU0_ASPPA|nr:hypothetical protein BDV34DRAFT_113647 [Aspergillus parasiticus]